MSSDPAQQNQLAPAGQPRSTTAGDLPDAVRRRYFAERRAGQGVDLFVDAQVSIPSLRDRGARLEAARTDPATIGDMVRIARHRGWDGVAVEGEATFRREAWLAARTQGLEVRGYRPTERDLQDLDRRQARSRRDAPELTAPPTRELRQATRAVERDPGARSHLELIEKVVARSMVEPAAQARILTAARERLAGWLDRGATFEDIRQRSGSHHPTRNRDERTR